MIKAYDIKTKKEWNTLGKPGRIKTPVDIAYENLANAIVFKAVRDYQHSLISLHFNPDDKHAAIRQSEVMVFFGSEFYKLLTNIDSDFLVKADRKQVEDRNWKRFYIGFGD